MYLKRIVDNAKSEMIGLLFTVHCKLENAHFALSLGST
jgi:hypothetical protein